MLDVVVKDNTDMLNVVSKVDTDTLDVVIKVNTDMLDVMVEGPAAVAVELENGVATGLDKQNCIKDQY